MPASQAQGLAQHDCRLTADAVVVAARADGRVDLEFAPPRGCGACAGTCLWKRLTAARLDSLPAAGPLEPGARVSVALSAKRLLLTSMLVHGLPLAAILAGAAAGAAIGGTDFATLAGALAALAIAVGGFGLFRRRLEKALLSGLHVTPRA